MAVEEFQAFHYGDFQSRQSHDGMYTANNRQTNEKKKITCVSLYSRHTCFKKLFFPFLLANI